MLGQHSMKKDAHYMDVTFKKPLTGQTIRVVAIYIVDATMRACDMR